MTPAVQVVYYATEEDLHEHVRGYVQGTAYSLAMLEEFNRQIPPGMKFTGYKYGDQWVSLEQARRVFKGVDGLKWPRQ